MTSDIYQRVTVDLKILTNETVHTVTVATHEILSKVANFEIKYFACGQSPGQSR